MKCPSQKSEFCMVLPFVLLFLAPGIKGPQLIGWLGSEVLMLKSELTMG